VQTLTEIKSMLAARGMHPRKRFGQNFLHDHNLIRKLVDEALADAEPPFVILEVGPGTGALTEAMIERLTQRGEQAGLVDLVLCEIDRDLADIVESRISAVCDELRVNARTHPRITLVRGDALASKHEIHRDIIDALAGRPFRLIANLPYSIASPLIVNVLMNHSTCDGIFVTIQKEVADRLLASPGTREYGPLSVIAQTWAVVTRIATLPPGCFWPKPEVTSSMVSLRPLRVTELRHAEERRGFARFLTDLFSKRRKQLRAIMGRDASLPPGLDASRRPESLSPAEMLALYRATRAM